MTDSLSRRDAIKVLGAAGVALTHADTAAQLIGPLPPSDGAIAADILPLTSTSEVFTPAKGRTYNTFSFDFPEPSVAFDGFRFGFIVFTEENAYALDPSKIRATTTADVMDIRCDGFTWAGGQEKAAGTLVAQFRKINGDLEWGVHVEMAQPIKTVSTLIRGIPRGRVGFGGPGGGMPNDNEILTGYPFSGGDLFGGNTAGGMGTPLAIVTAADNSCVSIGTMDRMVCTKRFFFQPGENGYRVEAIAEAPAWNQQKQWTCRSGGSCARQMPTRQSRSTTTISRKHFSSRSGRAHRRARLDAEGGTGDHHARAALHRLHLQRLCETTGDSALDGHADAGRPRVDLPVGVGWPLLLGLSQLQAERPDGRRRRASAS